MRVCVCVCACVCVVQVGSVVGAIPPMIGWAAVTKGKLDLGAWALGTHSRAASDHLHHRRGQNVISSADARTPARNSRRAPVPVADPPLPFALVSAEGGLCPSRLQDALRHQRRRVRVTPPSSSKLVPEKSRWILYDRSLTVL